MWTNHGISPVGTAGPYWFSSLTKAPRCKEETWRQHRSLCAVPARVHKQRVFFWFLLYLEERPPTHWVKESWWAQLSPWARSLNLRGNLLLDMCWSGWDSARSLTMTSQLAKLTYWKSLTWVLSLICLVALGDTLIEKSEVGAPSGMLYVHPWSRRATVWLHPASSFRGKKRSQHNFFCFVS